MCFCCTNVSTLVDSCCRTKLIGVNIPSYVFVRLKLHRKSLYALVGRELLARYFATMVLGEHCVQETFYDVLSVKETASYEEIRARYKSLILNYHPDKLQASEAGDADQSLGNNFFNIQKAWEILGNAESRRLYDNELRASKEDLLVAEDVGLDDMMVEYSGELLQFLYQCHCGDQFFIDSQELKEMGCTLVRDSNEIYIQMSDTSSATVILPCGSCSLRVRLLVKPGIKIFYG